MRRGGRWRQKTLMKMIECWTPSVQQSRRLKNLNFRCLLSTVSSREESDCFMGMIVWEAGGVSLENKLVKKPVTEERTPAVLFSTITPTFC